MAFYRLGQKWAAACPGCEGRSSQIPRLNVFRSIYSIFVWFSTCIGSPFKSWVFPRRNNILKPSVARGETRVGASEDFDLTSTSRVEKWGTPVAQVWRSMSRIRQDSKSSSLNSPDHLIGSEHRTIEWSDHFSRGVCGLCALCGRRKLKRFGILRGKLKSIRYSSKCSSQSIVESGNFHV
jgi:hypothetical protein